MALDRFRTANLANWDERVAGHTGPDGYNIDELVTDPDYITAVVRFDEPTLSAAVGSLTGKTLLHSQCHIGTDTMSWAKLGAQVTGIDFSPKALTAARGIADRLGIDATFVETELYDAPQNLTGEFDIVYTSVGTICWLPDLPGWAEVLAGFLRPGGTFYIRDSHPALMIYDDERDDRELVPAYPYFRATRDRRPWRTPMATSGPTRLPTW